MGTKNKPGAYDCYANAASDEPMFVLLGRDRHAATLVRLWALLRHRAGEDNDKVYEALKCAKEMDDWARGLDKTPEEFEQLLVAATEGMDEHPEGYDHSCACDVCNSYD